MKPFLSLCMIVKNEEKVLSRCLDSVYGIVDEIVIVDTGSTDSTEEIALKYVDQIYKFEWTNSFADARNYAQQLANGEWILVLDADEYVDRDNLQEMINVLKQTDEHVDAYDVTIYNFMGVYGERVLQHRSTRLYRNSPNIRYYRAIHEQLRKENGQPLNSMLGILNVYHSGYMHQAVTEKDKHKRNAPLIEKELQNRENVAFDYFNLGNEYLSKGEVEKALESFVKAYKQKNDFRLSWVSFCVVQIVLCLKYLERFEDALNVIADAENIYIATADFKYLKGEIYYLQHRYDDAAEELNDLIQNKDKYTHVIKTFEYLEYDPHILLGHIYKYKGDMQRAVQHYTSALSVNNKSYEALYNLLGLLAKFHSEDEIIQFLEKRNWFVNERDISLLLRIVLSLGLETIAEYYISKLKEETLKKGFQIKLNILKGEYEEAIEQLMSSYLYSLETYIKNGCFDLYDVLIASLGSGKSEVIRLLTNIVSDDKEKEFLLFIINETDHIPEQTFYLQLIERTLQLKKYDLFEQLISLKDKFENKINLYLGHLLHRYEFIEVALDFYQSVEDFNDLDAQGFANIIEGLAIRNQITEAIQYGLLGIHFGHNDFRLYKYVLELMKLNGMSAERNNILKKAKNIYPDSKWLMQQGN
ncbi:glycosyltransferase [Parageobacillus thermoglucosidasius]|uniref:tetratricopeptide repeat-containing glycosyltransferase family 2 protein n=1 Tax=Parageobacillus thermoglucosidasius TaxID=1426 RepID=UPI000E19FA96|nr:glycosyltransferase family 2 protein [Parageobacillus thermoglucosidasius]RDE36280.1 glycosyltransferase [Parageobacillus thermoglucosidasius]